MKVLFAGPSVYGCPFDAVDIDVRPPAAQGDLQACVLGGANVIGLVDGLFETIAANWHKEILFALSHGVTVLGAASMGALRAAECQAFGMIPIGNIAHRYLTGELDDDAAVAQLHGPAELGYMRLTEALVDCDATIHALVAAQAIRPAEALHLHIAAAALFFKERTWQTVVERCCFPQPRAAEILDLLQAPQRRLKQQDALRLVEALRKHPDERGPSPTDWQLAETPAWLRTLHGRGEQMMHKI